MADDPILARGTRVTAPCTGLLGRGGQPAQGVVVRGPDAHGIVMVEFGHEASGVSGGKVVFAFASECEPLGDVNGLDGGAGTR